MTYILECMWVVGVYDGGDGGDGGGDGGDDGDDGGGSGGGGGGRVTHKNPIATRTPNTNTTCRTRYTNYYVGNLLFH